MKKMNKILMAVGVLVVIAMVSSAQESVGLKGARGGSSVYVETANYYSPNTPVEFYDGDWGTSGTRTVYAEYYIVYEVAPGASSASWKLKTNLFEQSYTLPTECFSNGQLEIKMQHVGGPWGWTFSCGDVVFADFVPDFSGMYEEAVTFGVSNQWSVNMRITGPNYSQNVQLKAGTAQELVNSIVQWFNQNLTGWLR